MIEKTCMMHMLQLWTSCCLGSNYF